MGMTVTQLEGDDAPLVLRRAEAWEEQVRKLKGLADRYRTERKDVLEKGGSSGPAYEAVGSNSVEELTQLEFAQEEPDAVRVALEMAVADIRTAQQHLLADLKKAPENGAESPRTEASTCRRR